MGIEDIKHDIMVLSREDYNDLKRWMDRDERDRRMKIWQKEQFQKHKDKIKSFRKGHKLVIKRELVDLPTGTIVKLYNKKGCRTRIDIQTKNGQIWNVPISCIDDAEDEHVMEEVVANKRLMSLFS